MNVGQLKRALMNAPDDSKLRLFLEEEEYAIRKVIVEYDNLNKTTIDLIAFEVAEPLIETVCFEEQPATLTFQDDVGLFEVIEGPKTVGECRTYLENKGHCDIEPGTELETHDGRIIWNL